MKPDFHSMLESEEYRFLRENEHLGGRMILLCLSGSYGYGTNVEGSDVDLRIDKGDIRGLRFAGLVCDLEDALGSSVDMISTAGMDARFRREIAPEEVLLYEREQP